MLLYRRNKANGTWVVKAADGRGILDQGFCRGGRLSTATE
jgi:hypothetical protein